MGVKQEGPALRNRSVGWTRPVREYGGTGVPQNWPATGDRTRSEPSSKVFRLTVRSVRFRWLPAGSTNKNDDDVNDKIACNTRLTFRVFDWPKAGVRARALSVAGAAVETIFDRWKEAVDRFLVRVRFDSGRTYVVGVARRDRLYGSKL